MSNKFAVISPRISEICNKLKSFGYELIYTDCVDEFISYERHHADMQCFTFEDKVFVLSQCKRLVHNLLESGFNVNITKKSVSKNYPENILLNAKIIGNNLIGKINSIDEKLIKSCIEKGYNLIDVKQGYAACSITAIGENSAITADKSIYATLKNNGVDVLKINEGNIVLHDAKREESGFIGGASVAIDKNNVLFFGEIEKHPDYNSIKEFCDSKSVVLHSIDDMVLTDIGGVILLNN